MSKTIVLPVLTPAFFAAVAAGISPANLRSSGP